MSGDGAARGGDARGGTGGANGHRLGGDAGAGEPGRLLLPGNAARELEEAFGDAYPREGCAVLLGRIGDGDRVVERIEEARNRWPDRDDRYLVDPGTLRRLMDAEAEGGARILGFAHSHPDAEPAPSETDRELAWPWYHYLIVPVQDGRVGPGRAWQLDPDDGTFREREIRRAPEPAIAGEQGE